jgi:hypothetical protein
MVYYVILLYPAACIRPGSIFRRFDRHKYLVPAGCRVGNLRIFFNRRARIIKPFPYLGIHILTQHADGWPGVFSGYTRVCDVYPSWFSGGACTHLLWIDPNKMRMHICPPIGRQSPYLGAYLVQQYITAADRLYSVRWSTDVFHVNRLSLFVRRSVISEFFVEGPHYQTLPIILAKTPLTAIDKVSYQL